MWSYVIQCSHANQYSAYVHLGTVDLHENCFLDLVGVNLDTVDSHATLGSGTVDFHVN